MPDCGFEPSLRRCFTRLRAMVYSVQIGRWSRQLGLVSVEFDPLIRENFLSSLEL